MTSHVVFPLSNLAASLVSFAFVLDAGLFPGMGFGGMLAAYGGACSSVKLRPDRRGVVGTRAGFIEPVWLSKAEILIMVDKSDRC